MLKWTADVARYDIPADNWSIGLLQMWSGGGPGGNGGGTILGYVSGGTGGNYLDYWLTPADLPAFVAIDVGDEKAAPPTGNRGNVSPTLGNPTSFGSFTVANRGAVVAQRTGDGRYDGGGSRGGSDGRAGEGSAYGGGGGGGINGGPAGGNGGASIFAGDGGNAAATVLNPGSGNERAIGTGSPGIAPAGGGGAGLVLGGAGARGEVRLTLFY